MVVCRESLHTMAEEVVGVVFCCVIYIYPAWTHAYKAHIFGRGGRSRLTAPPLGRQLDAPCSSGSVSKNGPALRDRAPGPAAEGGARWATRGAKRGGLSPERAGGRTGGPGWLARRSSAAAELRDVFAAPPGFHGWEVGGVIVVSVVSVVTIVTIVSIVGGQ
jgi:hypothetical protein